MCNSCFELSKAGSVANFAFTVRRSLIGFLSFQVVPCKCKWQQNHLKLKCRKPRCLSGKVLNQLLVQCIAEFSICPTITSTVSLLSEVVHPTSPKIPSTPTSYTKLSSAHSPEGNPAQDLCRSQSKSDLVHFLVTDTQNCQISLQRIPISTWRFGIIAKLGGDKVIVLCCRFFFYIVSVFLCVVLQSCVAIWTSGSIHAVISLSFSLSTAAFNISLPYILSFICASSEVCMSNAEDLCSNVWSAYNFGQSQSVRFVIIILFPQHSNGSYSYSILREENLKSSIRDYKVGKKRSLEMWNSCIF